MNDFFKKELKCTNVPKQVLEFYAKCDGTCTARRLGGDTG